MASTEHGEYIEIHRYWLVLKRRSLSAAAVLGTVLLLTGVATYLQKPIYQADGELLLKKADSTSSLTGLGKEIGELSSISSVQSNPLETEAEIIRSVSISDKVLATLDLKDKKGRPVKSEEFLKRLDVKSIKGTDVLQISYKSNDPKEAATVVNEVMNSYLENNILTNRAQATAARIFIEEQMPKAEATVRQAEAALRSFKEINKVVLLQEEAKSAVGIIGELENEIAKARVALANAESRYAALQNKLGMTPQQAAALSSLSQSKGVQQALEDLQTVENQLELERTRFLDSAPATLDLKSKETSLRALLQERINKVLGGQQRVGLANLQLGELEQNLIKEFIKTEVERSVFTRQLTALNNEYANYKQKVNVLPKLEEKQRQLERKVEAAQSTYETLLKKHQEVRITEQQNVGNARIIQFAKTPEQPVLPKKSMNLILGLIAGVLLSVIAAFVLEARDKSIKTVREARDILEYTLLGVIPNFEKIDKGNSRIKDSERLAPRIPVKEAPSSLISECYRMLYANLKFLSSDKEVRVITVTSAVAREGKSTVSANLALAIAQLGFKVLLVDADMRHPSQQTFWELPNSVGLSNALVEQIELKKAIAEVMPNLYVLTSGVVPPNPLALLNSRRMASLIEDFSQSYDFVIIDTPPLNAAADARILGIATDGALMVIKPKLVDSASAVAAKELLEHSGLNILGMVVNGVTPEDEPDSYFHLKEYPMEKGLIIPVPGQNRLKVNQQSEG